MLVISFCIFHMADKISAYYHFLAGAVRQYSTLTAKRQSAKIFFSLI